MRCYTKSFLVLGVLVASVPLWSQEAYHFNDPGVFARLSYDSSSGVQDNSPRHICVAVSRDGQYRMLRLRKLGEMQSLEGKIPAEQFQQLKDLLETRDFRSLAGHHGGVMRQTWQTFGAEIIRGNTTHRLQWLNADGENPFPIAVSKVADWLTRFEPKGTPFTYAEYPDVCPSGGLQLLQPSVAGNLHP